MRSWVFALVVGSAACGGKVFVDGPGASGGGGGSGASLGTTSSTAGTLSTSTGSDRCREHADCPGGVCIFSTGLCAPSCEPESCDACTPGTVCEPCATSSCPSCRDCRAGCVASDGRCDDDDPCPEGRVCLFRQKTCAAPCAADGACGDFSFCDACPTGSCCGCDDCIQACVGGR
jgi:hypothetical protein